MKLKHLFAVTALLFCAVAVWGAQSKTYPTSATTQVRWDTYMDDIQTIYHSTYTVDDSTWVVLGTSCAWMNPGQYVYGWTEVFQGTTSVVYQSSWTLSDYNAALLLGSKDSFINTIANLNMEQYMVWPSTTPPDPGTWAGWCQSIVNGHIVPIACPQ